MYALRPILLSATLVLALGTTGCAIANRGELHVTRTISYGQELIDLQKARELGAISEDEFYHLKHKVIEAAEAGDVIVKVSERVGDD